MKNFVKKFQKHVRPQRHKICLAIPCTGTVRIETLLSVVGILSNTPHDFYTAYRTGCYIEQNRTNLIQTAIQEKCNKLFFLDADMIVESDVVNKLLALNKPIVGAAYNNRRLPLCTNVKISDGNGGYIGDPDMKLPDVPFQCAGVPTGCMLIDIASIKNIPHPWFDLTYFDDGSLRLGEDIYFCKKAQEHGLEVWCDPTIQIGHIGTFTY